MEWENKNNRNFDFVQLWLRSVHFPCKILKILKRTHVRLSVDDSIVPINYSIWLLQLKVNPNSKQELVRVSKLSGLEQAVAGLNTSGSIASEQAECQDFDTLSRKSE